MSTIPFSPTIDLPAPRVLPRIQEREYPPLLLPRIESNPRVKPRVQPRKRTRFVNVVATVLMNGVALGFVLGVFFLASSLLGTVSLESASRDAQRSLQRSHAAAAEESVLSRAVGRLRDADDVDAWASYNGFVSGRQAPQN